MIYPKSKTGEISFPIGGIGTGSIGLSGRGRLVDWEIFNRQSKGSENGYTNFIIRADKSTGSVCKVVAGDLEKELYGKTYHYFGSGPLMGGMIGYPHFEEHEFDGEFPFGRVNLKSAEFPGTVSLKAFNPFIPLNADDSSIPAAMFEIEVENTDSEDINYAIAFTVENPFKKQLNRKLSESMVTLSYAEMDKESTEYGDMTVKVLGEDTFAQEYFYRGKGLDRIITFWREFAQEKKLSDRHYDTLCTLPDFQDVCTVGANIKVKAGEKGSIRFVLTWNIPNYENYWNPIPDDDGKNTAVWKNYYATLFEDSVASCNYVAENFDRLYKETKLFKDTLFDSKLDSSILDAVSSTMSVLKSPTVIRLEDGSFWGFEGSFETIGSCQGTCSHVYTYAYALCFLFPELERGIRNYEFKYSTKDDGRMVFRTKIPLGREDKELFRPCVDGQMGSVLKVYREWKLSGDDEWLKSVWEKTKMVLEFAWSKTNPDMWDLDKDGVLEGRQHHTLDMELYGPSSWLEGFYLIALKAASIMADYLGDTEKAKEYAKLFEKGYNWTKENLFNGKYFFHKVDLDDKSQLERYLGESEGNDPMDYWNDETNELKYQIAEGSSIDQMCAQWHSAICGLGDIFDKEQRKIAAIHLFKNNYKPTMRNFINAWRIFCLNDEAGSVICDYPDYIRVPYVGAPYCQETMHGFEYQMAGLLVSEGYIDEAITVVKAVRDRYDGAKRNPWNEMEFGNNYARSMASFALIPLFAGFEFDLPFGRIGFNPRLSGDFKSFWSLGTGWGQYVKTECFSEIKVYAGKVKLKSINLPYVKSVSKVISDGCEIEFGFDSGIVTFEDTVITEGIKIVY